MNFTELAKRWALESPELFKKLQKFGVYLIGLAALIASVPLAMQEYPLVKIDLSFLYVVSQYVGGAGFIISVVSKLPVKDPGDLK